MSFGDKLEFKNLRARLLKADAPVIVYLRSNYFKDTEGRLVLLYQNHRYECPSRFCRLCPDKYYVLPYLFPSE